jgi:hypothetical protein
MADVFKGKPLEQLRLEEEKAIEQQKKMTMIEQQSNQNAADFQEFMNFFFTTFAS